MKQGKQKRWPLTVYNLDINIIGEFICGYSEW